MDKTDKLMVLEEFYAHKLWFLELGEGKRIVGASIKIEPSGYLLVIKARSAEGPWVAFVGAATLDRLRLRVRAYEGTGKLKWRVDQFTLDRLGEI